MPPVLRASLSPSCLTRLGRASSRPLPRLALLMVLAAGPALAESTPPPDRPAERESTATKMGLALRASEGTPVAGGGREIRFDMAVIPPGLPLTFRPASAAVRPGLLSRYRLALERETRRTLDRDPSLFWARTSDEEGYPLKRAQREARRIFDGANGRLLSGIAEDLIEEAAALRTARDYVEGVSLDLLSGGGVRFKAGRGEGRTGVRDDEPGSAGGDVAASFGLIALGVPRLEMRTELPGGIRTRLEVPLRSPGLRASFSRRLTSRMRGTLSLGADDAGADVWLTAGLSVKL